MPNEPNEIAVLLAAYNGEKYLRTQLDSLLQQTYPDWTCYIHDDGSTDGTMAIISEYMAKHPGKIRYIEGGKCGGAKENFLFLMEAVDAKYYMFCDQDDYWQKEKIADSYKAILQTDPSEPACVYTDLVVVDEELNPICESFYHYTRLNPNLNSYKNLLMSNVCVGCTMIFNRALRDIAAGLCNDNIMMHDWQLALIASLKGELQFLEKKTVLYRQHGNNTLGASREAGLKEKLKRNVKLKEYLARSEYYRERPRKMANNLREIDELEEEKALFLKRFSTLSRESKYRRVKFYWDNQLYRQRINRLWQLLKV